MPTPHHTLRSIVPALLCMVGMLSAACRAQRPVDHGVPLARLGNEIVGEADFQRYVADTFPPEHQRALAQSTDERRRALDAYLDWVAVLEKARRTGVPREQRFEKAVVLGEMKLLAQAMTERHRESILRDSAVSLVEVAAYYDTHAREFPGEIGFSFRQILIYTQGNPAFPDKGLPEKQAREKAAKALAALRKGSSWDAVATAYSDDRGPTGGATLIRDGRFGYFPKEVEAAIRTQPIGQPGDLVRTLFGYHVIAVVDRVLDPAPKPFAEVKAAIEEHLRAERSAEARLRFLSPIQTELGFELSQAGQSDVSLANTGAVAPDTVLAVVAKRPVLEEDFQWFLRDAFLPSQRMAVYNRDGSRQGMLRSFLAMRLLDAKARKEGLHHSPDYLEKRRRMLDGLLFEFMQEREKLGPFCQCGDTPETRRSVERVRLDAIRSEVGLVLGTRDGSGPTSTASDPHPDAHAHPSSKD